MELRIPKLAELKDGRTVLYRRGKAYEGPDGTIIKWESEQYQIGQLVVPLRDRNMPKAYRSQSAYWRAGDPASIGLAGMVDWAEYRPDDYNDEFGHLECEGWLIELRLEN